MAALPPAQAAGAAPPATATVPQQPGSTGITPPLLGPWPDPSMWGPRWPGPARPAPPATLAALLAAAAVAAFSNPVAAPGVGWLITAVAGVAAVIGSRRAARPHPPGAPASLVRQHEPARAVRYGWAAITVALLGVGTVRSAGWLFALCLCTAAVTGALAAAGGRSAYAMLAAAGTWPMAALRALPWVSQGLRALGSTGTARSSGPRLAATAGVSLALLTVFGALFASADATFARMLGRVVPDLDTGTVLRWCFVGGCAGAALAGVAFLRAAPPDLSGLERPGTRRVRRLEWAVPLGALVLLFAAFVTVQVTVLFGGGGHVLRTDGLTYAEYARGGFWQLLVVTGLTLLVLAGAARWAPRDTPVDRRLIRLLLGALTCLALLIVGSALHRMDVYADTYGLTRLRLLVALCEAWLGLVFVLILAAGVRLRATWLPRAVVATGTLALLGLAAANPDALIAERNVDRFQVSRRLDARYLSTLSTDAVPVLDRLPARERACALSRLAESLQDADGDWREWNLGRERARRHLAAHPAGPLPGSCPGWTAD
jgi:hypothetical protein